MCNSLFLYIYLSINFIKMTQDELRKKIIGYMVEPSIKEYRDVLDMFSNFFLIGVKAHHRDKVDNEADLHAKLILQMMLTKILHLKNLINGVSFTTYDNTTLTAIVDPTVSANIIRNIFETTGMFNLIFRATKTNEEKQIVYLLWVIAGLSYRQRFESNIVTQDVREKYEFEKAQIIQLQSLIEQNGLFRSLDSRNQDKIRNRIKQKEFLIKFKDGHVVFLAWHQLVNVMGIKYSMFDNIYTYFSLYTHPSYVSVFQFGQMFLDDKSSLELTKMNLRFAVHLFSIFIADYINLFPKMLNDFERLPILDQIVLNFPNKALRGEEYSINNASTVLG